MGKGIAMNGNHEIKRGEEIEINSANKTKYRLNQSIKLSINHIKTINFTLHIIQNHEGLCCITIWSMYRDLGITEKNNTTNGRKKGIAMNGNHEIKRGEEIEINSANI